MSVHDKQLIESVFAGGGDMGARMRAIDWSQTNLGPLSEWPHSLRACVRVVLGSTFPMLVSWGPDYTMLYNDAYGVVVGSKSPGALGCSCKEVLAEAWDFIGPLFDKVFIEGAYTGILTSQQFTFHRHDYLEDCHFAFSYSPIPDDDGKVGGVLTACLDITQRVIEDRRRQVLRDLSSSTAEARYEEDVWRVSAETLGQHLTSAPFAVLYVYSPDDRRTTRVASSIPLPAELEAIGLGGEACLCPLNVATGDELPCIELGDRAARVPIPGWAFPPTRATVVPIRLREHSEIAGFLMLGLHPGRAFDDDYKEFVRHIAGHIATGLASARAYEQERQRAEALAEIDRAKTAFFSNVSHEFRTPLTLMLGPLEEVLLDSSRLGSDQREHLTTVRRNSLRLLKLVNTLLDFSRIEAGRVQAVYEPTDLSLMTAEIASVFRSAVEKAQLRFDVNCEPLPEPVYVDRDMWEKIVSNLLSNAYKFTFEGEVAVALRAIPGFAELVVRDTGVGIADDQISRVFDRFHRIEGTRARTFEGTGIGLALVQELVKLHGGTVSARSAFGVGSTFTVAIPLGTTHLPAERIQTERTAASTAINATAYAEEADRWSDDDWSRAAEAPPLLPSAQPARTKLAASPARALILIADDNADMRQYLGRLIHERYDVMTFPDGAQALEAARSRRPALILTDVMMPMLDGFGLLRAIRSDPALASTPVLLVSARAGEESRVEGLQAGADDYLVKPFTSKELLARIEAHLTLSTLRREAGEREERLRNEAQREREKLHASEAQLRETSRLYTELQQRNAMIRRLVDANIVGVLVWGAGGRISDANEEFLRLIGYSRSDLTSQCLRWQDLTPPEWLERDEAIWLPQLRATGTVPPFEKEYLRKDGTRVPVLIGLAGVGSDGHEGVAFVLDLTDRKRSADALRELQTALAHANRLATMGQLAASIAHEVNQPIGAARNNAYAALRFLSGDRPNLVEARDALDSVVSDTYQAGDIIDRIREHIKKMPPRREAVDVNDSIEEVVSLVRGEVSKNMIELLTDLSPGLPPAMGDRVQIQQVLLNLVLNAMESMSDVLGRPRQLRISTRRNRDGQVLVSVSDSGIGIANEDRERIFESFFTTKDNGLGIGLTICRSILSAIGGKLWAEGRAPFGSTFKFTLPSD